MTSSTSLSVRALVAAAAIALGSLSSIAARADTMEGVLSDFNTGNRAGSFSFIEHGNFGKITLHLQKPLPMRKRYTAEQIAQALRQAEAGTPIVEIIRKMGVHENTFHLWKKRYGGLGTPEIRGLRQLREENRKLEKLVADLSLDRNSDIDTL